jgi:hypothetical protein
MCVIGGRIYENAWNEGMTHSLDPPFTIRLENAGFFYLAKYSSRSAAAKTKILILTRYLITSALNTSSWGQ